MRLATSIARDSKGHEQHMEQQSGVKHDELSMLSPLESCIFSPGASFLTERARYIKYSLWGRRHEGRYAAYPFSEAFSGGAIQVPKSSSSYCSWKLELGPVIPTMPGQPREPLAGDEKGHLKGTISAGRACVEWFVWPRLVAPPPLLLLLLPAQGRHQPGPFRIFCP